MSYPPYNYNNYNQGVGNYGQPLGYQNQPPYAPPGNYGPSPTQQYYPTQAYPQEPVQQSHGKHKRGRASGLRGIFDAWDTDRSGSIDEYELAQALKDLGEDYSPSHVRSMMEAYDKDRNGTIEFNEFEDLYTYIQGLRGGFQNVTDNRGEISIDRAEQLLTKGVRPTELIGGSALIYSLWKIYDKRGTGKLNWKDFLLLALAFKAIQKGNKAAPVHGSSYSNPYTGAYQQQPTYVEQPRRSKLGKLINTLLH